MDTNIFNKIKEMYNLQISQDEFENYLTSLHDEDINLPNIQYSVYDFTVPFKGKIIKNLTGNKDALYYVLEFGSTVILQTIIPAVSGNQPITQENVENIVQTQIEELKKQFIENTKIHLTIDHFKG